VSSYGALAGTAWCRSDPILVIDNTLTQVFVSGPLTAPLRVTGPTEVIVTVPTGVRADLILTDLGFGRGWDVTIKESSSLRHNHRIHGTEVLVSVYVPARTDMPIRLETSTRLLGILSPASVEGTANSWVHLKTRL
jgi:hypothetical protein